MPNTLNKIQRGFSKSANSYDHNSQLHQEIADRMLDEVIRGLKPKTILDVGCGTGYLTVKLKEQFPQADVLGLDFSEGMLEVARVKHKDIAWVLADINNIPFSNGRFDLVVSNLAFQWSIDLGQTFGESRRVLAPNGVLACTLFGYHTCQELFQSLDEAQNKNFPISRLPDEIKIKETLLLSGFKNPNIDTKQLKKEFKDMSELIGWLKSIGANNLSREGFLGPEVFLKAAAIYQKKYPYLQGVGATFEVIRIYAKK